MPNRQNPIVAILAKYALRQELSDEEQRLLDEWRSRSEEHEEWPDRMRDAEWRELHRRETEEVPSAAMWENISHYIDEQKERTAGTAVRRQRFPRYRVAAAVILLAGVGGGIAIWSNKKDRGVALKPVDPARLYAIARTDDSSTLLRLGDGKVLNLDRYRPAELVCQEEGLQVMRTEGGIVYTGAREKAVWHELSVGARARRPLRVDFPGGHRVWLNRASQFAYATGLKDGPDPILNGEAGFDIKKDYFFRPFQVRTQKGESMTVLGTFFSIRSFTRERQSRIELYSGKIQVQRPGDSLILRPESVALLTEGAATRLVRAEPGKEAPEWIRPAGKGRFFEFDNTPMGVALQEVAEWYLVDLANPEGIEGISVTGRLSRDESLDNTLRQFEQVESGRIVLVHKADSIIIKNGAAAPHKK